MPKRGRAAEAESQVPTPATPRPSLDEALVALQKSFSRVSTATEDVPEEQARALIVGTVNFEMTTRVTLEGDRYYLDGAGATELRLSGTIEPDIRIIVDQPEGAPAQ